METGKTRTNEFGMNDRGEKPVMTDLRNRVQTFAQPDSKERLVDSFTKVLGCEMLVIPGPGISGPVPVIAFRFSNGSSLSVGFSGDAR